MPSVQVEQERFLVKPFALGQQGATLPGEFADAPIGPTPVRWAGTVSSWPATVWSWRAALACQLCHLYSQRIVAESCRLQGVHKGTLRTGAWRRVWYAMSGLPAQSQRVRLDLLLEM